MSTRELTEAEQDMVDLFPDHTNLHNQYCCPHCLKSSAQDGVLVEEPVAATCPECGMEFVAWRSSQEIFCSGQLPAPAEDGE